MSKLRICLAQVEVIPGAPQENLKKVLECIENAKDDGADIIVFSEMVIPGYLLGDAWERSSFIKECMDCNNEIINAAGTDITVVWGNVDSVEKNGKDGRPRKFNKASMWDGALHHEFNKTLQPNYREFDDDRHFYSNSQLALDVFNHHESIENFENADILYEVLYRPADLWIKGESIKTGVILCEDGWDTDYTFSPVEQFVKRGAKLIINISCSPYTHNKNSKRNRIFHDQAKFHGVPIIYVNNVGIQNNGKTVYTFDGNSCIYDKMGNQLNPYDDFTEGCQTFEIDLDEEFGDPEYDEHDDISMLHKAIVYGTKGMMNQLGIKKVVIGASGGIDSALNAAIYSEILDPKDLLLVNMPSQYNSETTKDLAYDLAKNIGCNYAITPIEHSVNLTYQQISSNFIGRIAEEVEIPIEPLTDFAMENVQARDRSSRVLAAWASYFGGVFTNNGNKSETTVGYATLYGDVAGWLANLADLWKTEVYEMARYINKKHGREIIPQGTIDLIPSAELSAEQSVDAGKGDPIKYEYHDLLFKSWVERWDRATPEDILDWALDPQVCLEHKLGWFHKAPIMHLFDYDYKLFIDDLERWWNCYDGLAVAKRIQAPPVLAVSRRAFGFDMRESQGKPYYSKRYYELKGRALSIGKIEVIPSITD